MKFILIAVFATYGGFTSLSFTEFDSEASCQAAVKKSFEMAKGTGYHSGDIRLECVKK